MKGAVMELNHVETARLILQTRAALGAVAVAGGNSRLARACGRATQALDRARYLLSVDAGKGGVLYWPDRDNLALREALEAEDRRGTPPGRGQKIPKGP